MKQKITLTILIICFGLFTNAQTNLALRHRNTAIASTNNGEAKEAVDGNLESRWTSTSTGTEWIKVDLGVDREISEVRITWESAKAAAFTATFINDAGVTLTSETISGTNPQELVDYTVNSFTTNVQARYITITCTAPASQYNYSIREIAVTDDSPKPSASSEISATNSAKSATDGNIETRWESETPDNITNMPQWISVDLKHTYNLNKVDIYWENAKAEEYLIEASDDNLNWTTVSTITGNIASKPNSLHTQLTHQPVMLEFTVQKELLGIMGIRYLNSKSMALRPFYL